MKLEIKRMVFDNFRGFSHKEIEFDGNSKVLGANACGKTTLFFGWVWLMSDRSDALISNPNIIPVGMEECEAKVEAEILIDGKPCTISKSQKYKQKIDDAGKVVSSANNKYTINGVDKTATSFVADLKERGVDLDNFLILSHPFAFTADTSKKGREEMRKVLFKMVNDISELDIAKSINVPEVTGQLEKGYKIEEIEQMARGSLKSLNDRYGKQNELIDSKISGILESKSTLDGKVLNEQKKTYEAEIERIEKELSDLSSSKANVSKKLSDLQIKKDEILREANRKHNEVVSGYENEIRTFTSKIDNLSFQLEQLQKEILRIENVLSESKENIEKQRTLYKIEQDAVIDEGDLYCPVCHRTYDAEKLSEIKAEFEKNKAQKLKTIKSTGDTLKAEIKSKEKELKELQSKSKSLNSDIEKMQKERAEIEAKLDKSPDVTAFVDKTEYDKIVQEISESEVTLAKSDTARIEELTSQKNVNRQMLNQVIAELGSLERNSELDEKVKALRKEKKEAEIQRSMHEKMIFEVETFKKAKNEKLSDSINSHFEVAQFRLFKVLKNGSIEDACDVIVDGKEINQQANQSLQVLARLDIIKGLSDFFEVWFPVFCDDFALFTHESEERIKLNNQTIKLIATDGINELKVEGE